MSLLLRFALARPLRALDEMLAAAPGLLAVAGPPALALYLAQRREVVALSARITPRIGRRLGGRAVRCAPGVTPLAGGSLGALLACDPVDEGTVGEQARAVREGGSVLLWSRHTRLSRQEHTRLALAARLVDLEQRVVGRIVLTRGVIKSFG